MGPYLSFPTFWASLGLILLSRELLEAREDACLRGCRAQAKPDHGRGTLSPGPASVSGESPGTHSALSSCPPPSYSASLPGPSTRECLTEARVLQTQLDA